MKTQINLSYVNDISDIIDMIKNDDIKSELSNHLDNDKKFFKILWDNYDLSFSRDTTDTLSKDIYSSDPYVKDSFEYNFVLDKIIRDFSSKKGVKSKLIKLEE